MVTARSMVAKSKVAQTRFCHVRSVRDFAGEVTCPPDARGRATRVTPKRSRHRCTQPAKSALHSAHSGCASDTLKEVGQAHNLQCGQTTAPTHRRREAVFVAFGQRSNAGVCRLVEEVSRSPTICTTPRALSVHREGRHNRSRAPPIAPVT